MSNRDDDEAMAEYYGRRAPLYDAMYRGISPAGRTPMLEDLFATVAERAVLELACGTGFWSEWIAPAAASVLGVDRSLEMLAIARARPIAGGKVEFRQGSVYDLGDLPAHFTAGIAIQWFSHVPIARYAEFFASFHGRLLPGARVFMADNIRQNNETDSLFQKPYAADTYEERTLPDGSRYQILKNYFAPGQLEQIVPAEATAVRVQFGKTWWWMTYEIG